MTRHWSPCIENECNIAKVCCFLIYQRLIALATAAASFLPLPYAYWAGTANSLASALAAKVPVNFGFPPNLVERPVGHSKLTFSNFFERGSCHFKIFRFGGKARPA